jgi:hypothetical protein
VRCATSRSFRPLAQVPAGTVQHDSKEGPSDDASQIVCKTETDHRRPSPHDSSCQICPSSREKYAWTRLQALLVAKRGIVYFSIGLSDSISFNNCMQLDNRHDWALSGIKVYCRRERPYQRCVCWSLIESENYGQPPEKRTARPDMLVHYCGFENNGGDDRTRSTLANPQLFKAVFTVSYSLA